jgi:hypothetical protein
MEMSASFGAAKKKDHQNQSIKIKCCKIFKCHEVMIQKKKGVNRDVTMP